MLQGQQHSQILLRERWRRLAMADNNTNHVNCVNRVLLYWKSPHTPQESRGRNGLQSNTARQFSDGVK
jgi:hypothetical protein